MENVPKNRDRERTDAVLDWGMEGWRLAHLLTHRLSTSDCIACGVDTWEEAIPWPCETVRAITDALTPKENDS